jgi:hypothetical protein
VQNAESQHSMHKVRERNYSSCTGRSSENLCSSTGGAHTHPKSFFKKLNIDTPCSPKTFKITAKKAITEAADELKV